MAVACLWGNILPARVLAEDIPPAAVATCAAATPVPNPWTKKMPAGWWIKRHEEILASPQRPEAQLAFIGDSITDGWDAEGSGLGIWEKEYLPLHALNLGIVCDSTQHALWRLDNGEIDNLPKLKVIVVMIGVNNKGINRHQGADVAQGITAICERLRKKAPQAKILLMGTFPRMMGADNNDDINSLIAKLDDTKHIFYLNINEKLIKTDGAIADRVGHVNAKGYQIWADEMRPLLKKLME